MENNEVDLGLLESLQAESFGEPGQRTFRLLATTRDGTISLWLEKEQVVALGAALDELLRRYPAPRGESPRVGPGATIHGDIDVRVGALGVGYDSLVGGFRVEATEFLSNFDLDSIGFVASRRQFETVSVEIAEIVRAGRPRCIMCGAPLTGEPHFCPQSNGHAKYDA